MLADRSTLEIKDRPVLARCTGVVCIVFMGGMLSFFSIWDLRVHPGLIQTQEIVWLGIGAAVVLGGVVFGFMPVRAPLTILRADCDGLTFTTDVPPRKNSKYEFIPWSHVFGIRAVGEAETIGIELIVSADYYQRWMHTPARWIPLPMSRKKAERVASEIRICQTKAASHRK